MTESPYPPTDDRDLIMGRFMDAWSSLEDKLFVLFWKLTKTDYYIAKAIYSIGIQPKNLAELLITIAPYRLTKPEQKTLKSLCGRFGDFAIKRNKIIHSTWQIENIADKSQWVRICSPIDYQKRSEICNLKNQAIRRAYRFTLDELIECVEQIEILHNDFDNLINPFIDRLSPYEG